MKHSWTKSAFREEAKVLHTNLEGASGLQKRNSAADRVCLSIQRKFSFVLPLFISYFLVDL